MPRFQTSMVRLGWTDYLKREDRLVSLTILGRYPVRVLDILVPATLAMEQALIATDYENPCDYISSYYPRIIRGYLPETWSWHAISAIDLDYGGDNPESPDHPGVDRNPYLRGVKFEPGWGTDPRCQITERNVLAVESIRTNNGKQVWLWKGWDIGDTMHFEPNCSPEDLATGILGFDVPPPLEAPTPQTPTEEDRMILDSLELVKRGVRGSDVAKCQGLLTAHGIATDIDGIAGPQTEGNIIAFQKREQLTVDGLCGPQTWTALLTR